MIRWSRRFATVLACTVSLSGCGSSSSQAPSPSPVAASPSPPPGPASPAAAPPAADVNAALDAFFEERDQQRLARSPQSQSFRNIKTDYDKWDDPSDAADDEERRLDDEALADMRARFAGAALDESRRMSFVLFEDRGARAAAAHAFRDHGYVFNQMSGPQSGLPAFLINIHRVTSKSDAVAYVRRLDTLGETLLGHLAVAEGRARAGIAPPRWVYPYVISDATNVITGAPFGPGADSALFSDLKAKVASLKLPEAEAAELVEAGRAALVDKVAPAYRQLIAAMKAQEKRASKDDGVWRLPRGAEYYSERLRNFTTTAMTAEEIHALGLREVARIHGEMKALMPALGFSGTFPAFLSYMRDRKDLYFSNDAAGRAAYLAATEQAIKEITAKLPQWFSTLPKTPLLVKPVEAFREKSAGKAFYQRPAPDGSRPGIYYVNFYDMKAMPNTEVEALAYHEAMPGHHFQIALQTEAGDLPAFRKFGSIVAYSEGWGLYSEKLAKEMGQYREPLRDFGRLQLELHRAIRLVVDTGLHHKRWTREQGIRYVTDNTAEPQAAARKAIERYIVSPGQATAYMIGRLKISELRERAATALGAAYDVRGFHDVVLRNGPISLSILEQEVNRWIASEKQK